jgi:hypothetical protein
MARPDLDFSPPPFTLSIGEFDATAFVHGFTLEAPALEMNSIATWHGSFEVRYNDAARSAGLSPADFSEQTRPDRWREGQQPVAITVMGYPLPIVRIDADYAYDEQLGVGKGRFYQYLDILSGDRPNINPDIKVASAVPLGEVVEKLLDAAMEPARIKRPRTIAGLTGVLDAPLSTRDPINDAQLFCGVSLQWLAVDNTESIVTVSGEPSAHPILFARSIDEVIFTPNRQSIHDVGEKIVVTGARQVPDIRLRETCPPNPTIDELGRSKFTARVDLEPFRTVFPMLPPGTSPPPPSSGQWNTGTLNKGKAEGGVLPPGSYSAESTISRKTTNQFAYPDPDSGLFRSYISLIPFDLGEVLFDIYVALGSADILNCKDFDKMTAVQTVTIIEEPAGKIFPQLGANTNPRVAEVAVKTPFLDAVWVPVGKLKPELGTNFNLKIKTMTPITEPRNDNKCGGGTDPKTGNTVIFSDRPKPEPQQQMPEKPLKTEALKGTCTITPIGWTPIISNPKPIALGFIPDQEHADRIACYLAAREVGRRDQHFLTMPIANCPEWLQAGCPVVGKVRIHDGDFIFDSVIIKITDKTGEIGMTCGRLNRISPIVPSPALPLPYIPTSNLQIIAPQRITAIAGTPFRYQLSAVGG